VFIQTPAQEIEVRAGTLLLPVLGVVLGFCILAGGAMLLYLRRILHPVSVLSGAAKAMSEGNFSVRAPEGKATCPEIAELSASFNTMAEKLSQLEESRREFVANVSHELRSPITAISGYVEGMRDGTIGQEDYPQYLTIVSDETTRLKNLIGDLLKLSRLEKADAALNKTNFDICELLSRVLLHRTGDLEAKKMDVECDFAPEPCMVSADESRIEQVAVNLLDNAIKFTPDGGVIRMSVRVNQGICTVIVQDNGVGISPEDRPHVFERFYTADKAHTSGKGTGLGLSICQRIMEMHGQKITLMDTGDEAGAAFAFTLDCAK
jgi:signal transduction histidine kinase